jgi:hypothetical protein
MQNTTSLVFGAPASAPATTPEDMQARLAYLEATLAEADRFIVNALESSIGFEDMCRKLRSAHASLADARRKTPTRAA